MIGAEINFTGNITGRNQSEIFPNRTNEEDLCPQFRHWFKFYWFFMDIACTVGSLVGNSLVIAIVYRNKGMRNIMNYLFVCMSSSDILAPAVAFLHDMLFLFRYDGGDMNPTTATPLCKFLPYFMNTSLTVSVLCLVAITCHRFYVVLFPLRALNKMSQRKVYGLIASIWFVAITSMLPIALQFELSVSNGQLHCYYSMLKVFDILQIICLRVTPLALMIGMYSIIICKLRRQKPVGDSCSEREQQRRREQSISMTKMSLTIVSAFVILIGTNDVFISLYSKFSKSCVVHGGIYITQAFVPLSSVVNPIIYFIYCKTYRTGLRQVFTRRGPTTVSQNTVCTRMSRHPNGRISQSSKRNSRHSSIENNSPLEHFAQRISFHRSSSLELNGKFSGSVSFPSSFFKKEDESIVLTQYEKRKAESSQI